MRKTISKGRKTNNDDFDESADGNSESIQMELELLAVKAKNIELTKAHAKLVHENYEMRTEILSLQRELVDIEAKSNSVETEFKKLAQDMSRCTPSLIDILNLFLQVTNGRKSRGSILGTSNRISDNGYTPKAKAITHTVKPHTVNGTVLNLNPTISLTRLNSTNNRGPSEEPSSSTNGIDYRNSLPSTSATSDNGFPDVENGSGGPHLESLDGTNEEFVLRKSQLRHRSSTPRLSPLVTNSENAIEMEVDNDEVETEEQLDDSQDSIKRLATIQEESICSSGGQRMSSIGEIRIYLSRLSDEDLQEGNALNESRSSTTANVNDTRLNIETTVIENPDNSNRLRADIMVFSPHTNSTTMDSEDSDCEGSRTGRSVGVPAVSAIQSAEVTPSSGIINDEEGLLNTCNPLGWLPTPSMSAMGDIDRSNFSRLDILADVDRKLSPMPPSASPPRNTRSKTRRRFEKEEDSPRTSRATLAAKRPMSSFISRQRGGSNETIENTMSPTVALERLENTVTERRVTRSSPIVHDGDDTAHNENKPDNIGSKSRKSKPKHKSKSPKRSAKRKKTEDDIENTLQDKIREIQIRLSNYVPETSMTVAVESPKKMSDKRPTRAAKPTVLKENSLKKKLRRML